MEERIIKKLMTSVKCTSCGQNYEARDVKILGSHEDLYFLQVTCSACYSRYMITASVNGEKNPEIVSDLTREEFTKFKNTGAPGTNDVLDMHAFLKDFNGDFSGIFGDKKYK
jgi:ribosomal protein S27E